VSKAFEYVGDRSLSKSSWYDHLLIVPIQYDDTTTFVRQSVADHFNFMLCRPRWITRQLIDTEDRYYHICLSSSNCLIGSTTLFTQFPFDEAVPFVYEDLIMTWRMSHSWVRIMCDTWISVAHAHGHRTKLAQLYINTPLNAYYKAKHRILFVHTIGKTRDKILFYLIGLPGQTAWLVSHILRYAPPKHRYWLVIALMRGTKDGIREAGRRS
jgi:hypothetical protein